jgi:hypothetical protein
MLFLSKHVNFGLRDCRSKAELEVIIVKTDLRKELVKLWCAPGNAQDCHKRPFEA